MYTRIIKKWIIGCHGNRAISHIPDRDFSLGQNSLHLVCPDDRFGTHETLSWGAGCKADLISCLPGINPSHAVCDLSRVRQYPPWLLFTAFVDSGGTQGTTHRRHTNNDAHEIDDFIGCEGDFPI